MHVGGSATWDTLSPWLADEWREIMTSESGQSNFRRKHMPGSYAKMCLEMTMYRKLYLRGLNNRLWSSCQSGTTVHFVLTRLPVRRGHQDRAMDSQMDEVTGHQLPDTYLGIKTFISTQYACNPNFNDNLGVQTIVCWDSGVTNVTVAMLNLSDDVSKSFFISVRCYRLVSNVYYSLWDGCELNTSIL